MGFLGRTRELKALQEAWGSARSGFIPIYGRRRVGKSGLIVHFMPGKPGRDFPGKSASGEAQLQGFREAGARAVGDSPLAQARVTHWKTALELVTQRQPGNRVQLQASHPHGRSSEPPPRFSVQRRVAIRGCLVRSTVTVGGGHSPLSFGGITTRNFIS
jgi:hypothetical protein